MVRRPDLVLAAIPVLALSGPVVDLFAPTVGTPIEGLPLTPLGAVCASFVVVYALARLPKGR